MNPVATTARIEPATRDRLLRAALEAFAAHGFEGASARHIERLAGVERGLVAYHFGTKEALWTEAVDTIWSRYVEEVTRLLSHLQDVSPLERARAILMAYARFNAAWPQFFRILVAEGYHRTSRSDHLARHLRAGINVWRTALGSSTVDDVETDEAEAIMIYQVMSAAAGPFAMAAYGEPVFGVDTADPSFIEHFATILADRRWV